MTRFADETETDTSPLPDSVTELPAYVAPLTHENSTTALPAPSEAKIAKKGVELRELLIFDL